MELVRIEREIAVSAHRAWALVSDFGGLSRWNPSVTACTLEGEGVGATRTIWYPDGLVVREQLAALDATARKLVYLFLSGRPLPVRGFTGAISVAASSRQASRVAWSYDADYTGPGWQLTEFTSALASRTVRRLSDLEIAACQPTLRR